MPVATPEPSCAAERSMRLVLEYLEATRVATSREDAQHLHLFRAAMSHLGDVLATQLRDGPVSAAQWSTFLERSVASMVIHSGCVQDLPDSLAVDAAEARFGSEWRDICMQRTELEVLLRYYEGTPVRALVSDQSISECDETIRQRAEELGPVADTEIPHWIPSSHWWWRVPPRAPGWVFAEEWQWLS